MKKLFWPLFWTFMLLVGIAVYVWAADTKISALGELASGDVADADMFYIVDATGPTSMKFLWSSHKAALKTYMDTLYVNQNTTGSAGSLKSTATTGLMTITGPGAGETRAKTIRDANDTILELGGSYSPTGTWDLVGATINNPPTWNQNTSGTAANLSGTPALPDGTTATTQGASDNSTKLATTAYVDAAAPTNVTPVDTGDENATFYPILVDGATGSQATETDGELTYNPSTGVYTIPQISAGAAGFTVDADGDVVGKSFSTGSSTAPTITLQDSDDAAGTGAIYSNSGGGVNDIILSIGVEDSTGESTVYVELDGVTETVDIKKPLVIEGTQFKIPSSDADPTATAGYLRHDATIANFTNGGLVYYNGAAIKQLVDMTTATAQACTDDQVVAYDADSDLWYCKADANDGGATALDDIGDPDAATSITCADGETVTFLTSSDNETFLSIQNDDAELSDTTTMLDIDFSAVAYDGSSLAIYLNMQDYSANVYTFSGAQFSSYRPIVNYEGNAAGGGYTAYTVSQNLEAMDGAGDYVRGFLVDWTTADHTGGNIHAFEADLSAADAQSTEIAYKVTGAGAWDYDFMGQNGETISNATNGTWDFGSANLTTSGTITGMSSITSSAAEINGTITLENDETITNAGDGTILLTGATQSTGNVTIGNDTDAVDYALTFDGNASNMVVTWMEDESELTLLDSANEGLNIDFNTDNDNEVEIKSGTDKGVTQLSFSSLNLVTTGSILGAINIVTTTDGSESPSAAQMYGSMFIADHATATNDTTYTLPAAAAGMAACFYDNGAGTGGITIEIDDADVIILDGTALTAGNTIDSPGVAGDGANGDFICIVAIDATNWITLGRSGTWVDGGAN